MGHEERFPLPRRVAAIGSVKGPSPEYPVTTGKRRKQSATRLPEAPVDRCLAYVVARIVLGGPKG